MDQRPTLNRVADYVFIGTCLLLCGLALYRFLPGQATVAGAGPENTLVGQSVPLADLKLRPVETTVLVVVNSRCRFCTDSAPFYRRLAEEEAESRARWQIAFLGTEDNETVTGYLRAQGIPQPRVAALPKGLGVRGTPTLLMVDHLGRITRALAGKLSPGQEKDILSLLRK